jgi:phosphoglycerate dehydrogenase-like enzyme
MKIKILSYAPSLKEILSGKLKEFGLAAERIDYSKPILTQITDADVLVNILGKVNKPIIDACLKLKLVHQIGTEVDNIREDLSYKYGK